MLADGCLQTGRQHDPMALRVSDRPQHFYRILAKDGDRRNLQCIVYDLYTRANRSCHDLTDQAVGRRRIHHVLDNPLGKTSDGRCVAIVVSEKIFDRLEKAGRHLTIAKVRRHPVLKFEGQLIGMR